MRKFVIDTNVLLNDPHVVDKFSKDDGEIFIPFIVIEELDKKKNAGGLIGYSARTAIKNIERKINGTERNFKVIFVREAFIKSLPLPIEITSNLSNDNIILAVCLDLMTDCDNDEVVLLTQDTHLRLKAGLLNIKSEEYCESDSEYKPFIDEIDCGLDSQYTGQDEIIVDSSIIDKLYAEKSVVVNRVFYPNEAITLLGEYSKQSALGLVDSENNSKINLIVPKKVYNNRGGLNREQNFALAMILDKNIDLITIAGDAGTGKTYTALLGALAAVEHGVAERIIITRKFVHHGAKEGFLPGDLREKSDPWMEPFYANLEKILTTPLKSEIKPDKLGKDGSVPMKNWEYLFAIGLIKYEHLSFTRGVTYDKTIIIVDEASNMDANDASNIVWRCGEGSKIILLGDNRQIDANNLSKKNNGLAYTIQTWKKESLAAHITLVKGCRSRLVDRAVEIMGN